MILNSTYTAFQGLDTAAPEVETESGTKLQGEYEESLGSLLFFAREQTDNSGCSRERDGTGAAQIVLTVPYAKISGYRPHIAYKDMSDAMQQCQGPWRLRARLGRRSQKRGVHRVHHNCRRIDSRMRAPCYATQSRL